MKDYEIEAQLNNVKVAMQMGMISMEKGMEMSKDLLLKKHSAAFDIADLLDQDTIASKLIEKELRDAMDAGLLDIKINGEKATDIDVAIDGDDGAIVITNGKGETTEIIITVPEEPII